jgi:hypothetical protein
MGAPRLGDNFTGFAGRARRRHRRAEMAFTPHDARRDSTHADSVDETIAAGRAIAAAAGNGLSIS